jgi:hypothetical protein
MAKYFHAVSSFASLVVLTVGAFYVYYNTSDQDIDIAKKNFPTFKYAFNDSYM